MRKGKVIGKIFEVAFVSALIGAMLGGLPATALPSPGSRSQSQALAQEAKTWHVDDDLQDYPDADFTKIQDAVDAASAGDTILVYDGTYQEHVTLDKSVILKTNEGATIDGDLVHVIPPPPPPPPPLRTVTIVALNELLEGSDFVAVVNISWVADLDSCDYYVSYNPAVIEVTDVANGSIDGTEIPVDMWEFVPIGVQGTVRVLSNVPGVPGVSGSGYLAEIHFDVVGTACDTSELDLHDGELVDNMGREVVTTWNGASVGVLARLTTNANPPEGGSVTGGGDYECGSNVSIRATPADAYWEFTGWTGDGIADPTSARTTVLIDCTKTVTANFAKYENVVTVTIGAPQEVLEDSDFVARVNITQVENFDACNYDLSYDPTVIEVTEVSKGLIAGTEIPVVWGFIPPGVQGRIRVINNVPGVPGVTGAGYLSEIHFHVVGEPCNTSELDLHHGMLANIKARDIPAEWIDGSVHVSEVLPGDANADGQINSADITKVERIVLQLDTQTPGADANRDGQLNSTDITVIELIMLGLA